MLLAPEARLAWRREAVRAAMAERGLDAFVVTHLPNLRYLTNLTASAGVVVVTARVTCLLVDFRYNAAVEQLLRSGAVPSDTVLVPVPASYDEALATLLEDGFGPRVGFEAAHLTVKRHTWLTARLAAAGRIDLVPTEGLVESARLIKDEHEQAILREAARRLSGVARSVLAEGLRPGPTEREVAAAIDCRLGRAGFERPAFETIVASGPNSALPHARPGDRRLATGDLVVLDFGGVYGGYCVDLTRTVAVGPPSSEARRLYRAVVDAQEAAFAVIRAGVSTAEVDRAARDALGGYGLAEAFGHSTGHGLGLEVHEDPRVGAPRPEGPAPTPLAPGVVITVEPGVYVPDLGGVRLEDDVLVTATGYERLTDVPREERLLTS